MFIQSLLLFLCIVICNYLSHPVLSWCVSLVIHSSGENPFKAKNDFYIRVCYSSRIPWFVADFLPSKFMENIFSYLNVIQCFNRVSEIRQIVKQYQLFLSNNNSMLLCLKYFGISLYKFNEYNCNIYFKTCWTYCIK